VIDNSNSLKALALGGLFLLVQACGSTPSQRDCNESTDCTDIASTTGEETTLGISTFQPEMVIATDLVNALTQVPNYDKDRTIIRVPNSPSTFMNAVRDVLVKRGYNVVRSENRTGRGVLMVSTVKETNANSLYTYMVAVDRLAMKRTYLIENRKVAPVSSLFVRGISPSFITLSDGLFVE